MIASVNEFFVPIAKSSSQSSSLMENINVSVNCTTPRLYIDCIVTSNDTSLVHFPPEVDMSGTELTNAVSISLLFSRAISILVYTFNNTNAETAKALADAINPSIEAGFDASFTFNSTGTHDNYVNVTYTGSGITNLVNYIDWLMNECLISDLDGFSLAFVSMTNELNAAILVSAVKESGNFNRVYSLGTRYSTNIQVGAGDHKIDLLDLLGVNSLSPSPCALTQEFYVSTVISDSEPGLASPPSQLKGWYISL